MSKWSLIGYAAWLVILPYAVARPYLDGFDACAYFFGNVALLPPLLVALVVVQEFVVAAAARAQGDRVLGFVLGMGKLVWTRKIGRWLWWIAPVPLFGETIVLPSRRRGQLRRIVIARLCGSAALVAPAVLVLSIQGVSELRSAVASRVAPDALFVMFAGFVSALQLLSLRVPDAKLKQYQRLDAIDTVQRQVAAGAFDAAVTTARDALANEPEDIELQVALAGALVTRAVDDEAERRLRELAAKELPSHCKPVVLNNLAWLYVLRGAEADREAAERLSSEALALQDAPAVRGTRGYVLLWFKRYEEAEPLLQAAYQRQPDSRFGKMFNAAGLAILYAATDRPDDARTWLERARAEGIEHDVVARATAAVEPLSRR